MNISNISLNDLPYSIAQRMVDLMPPQILPKFREITAETKFLTKRRVTIVKKLLIESGEFLKQKKSFIVQKYLNINFTSVADGDQVVPFLSGEYRAMFLSGKYTWRQAMQLCHPKVETCEWYGKMELAEYDHDEFIQNLCRLFVTRCINIYFFQSTVFCAKLVNAVTKLKENAHVPYLFREVEVLRNEINGLIYIECHHQHR
uniref:F-box domain-containing protein n=1 Tax=Panagrellus redivivus TaxID=6233 RepID=A0A7E4VLX8_PANRE